MSIINLLLNKLCDIKKMQFQFYEENTRFPLDIVLSLLRPDELEKLQKYIASYLAKHGQQ